MKNLIIPKKSLKFSVEVTSSGEGLQMNIVRFIEVAKNETMHANAQLARYDALEVNGQYLNCHTLLKSMAERFQDNLEDPGTFASRIILKKGQKFGCA